MKIVFVMLLGILLLFLMVADEYGADVEGEDAALDVRGVIQEPADETVRFDGEASAADLHQGLRAALS